MKAIINCERENGFYIEIDNIRIIIEDGRVIGWYQY